MRYILAYFFGTVAVQYLSHLASTKLIIFLLSASVLLLFLGIRFHLLIFKMLAIFVFGFVWANIYAQHALIWPDTLYRKERDISVIGKVASIPHYDKLRASFLFLIEKNNLPKNTTLEGKIKLSWYRTKKNHELPLIHEGERWKFHIKLKEPHNFRNPGSFDYRKSLTRQHIHATAYVRRNSENAKMSANDNKYSWREKLLIQLDKILVSPTGTFIKALTLGIRSDFTREQWNVLQRTGTSHLMAISGLHVGMIATFVFFLISFFWRYAWKGALYFPAQRVAAIASLIAAIIYSALAGFSVSTQRALIMCSVCLFSLLFKKKSNAFHALMIALFLIALIDPLASLSTSFILSFAAVFFIYYVTNGRFDFNRWKFQKIREALYLQLKLSLALMPVTLFYFDQISIVSILANLVAIPWVTLLVLPTALLGLIFSFSTVGKKLLLFSDSLFHVLWVYLNYLSQYKFAVFYYSLINPLEFAFLIVGIFLLLAPRGFSSRYLSLIFFIPFFFAIPPSPKINTAKIDILDVGQGLSVIVRTSRHTLVYDTGPKLGSANDAGQAVIIPYLKYNKIKNIDAMIISHGDMDHRGGAKAIDLFYHPKKIITNAKKYFSNESVIPCVAGMRWNWDGVNFEIIHPDKNYRDTKSNNNSCVVRVSVGKHAALLTGDIEKPAEEYLVQSNSAFLKAELLLAPHHGSKTSSSFQFIKAVAPKVVVFSRAYANRYHFPHASVINRYKALKIQRLDTATGGMQSFIISRKGVKIRKGRAILSHYWQ